MWRACILCVENCNKGHSFDKNKTQTARDHSKISGCRRSSALPYTAGSPLSRRLPADGAVRALAG